MKVAAVAAGGGDRAEKVIRDFYITSLLTKPGEFAPEHIVNWDWINKSRKTGPCTCCCSFLFLFALIIFVAWWGFPGLLNLDKFETHYNFTATPAQTKK